MKKIAALLTIVPLVFLVSCGKKDDVKQPSAPQNPTVDAMGLPTPVGGTGGVTITPPSPPQVEVAKPVAPAEVKAEPKADAAKADTPEVKTTTIAVPPTPPVVAPVKPVEVKKEETKTVLPKEEIVPLNDTPKTAPKK